MYFPEDDTIIVDAEDIPETIHVNDKTKKNGCLHKITSGGTFDPNLLVCKLFYFLFYGAYGCIFPLIAVYFKQLGLTAFEIGILIGIRPFIEFCAAPIWGGIADTYKKGKFILLLSLFSWLIFTEALAFVRPQQTNCVAINLTNYPVFIHSGTGGTEFIRYSPVDIVSADNTENTRNLTFVISPSNEQIYHNNNDADQKPSSLYNDKRNKVNKGENLLKNTTKRFSISNKKETFVILLILIMIGEFFSSPTITLADSATLGYLGRERMIFYGRQRMFGSLGWGVTMVVMGFLLDYVTIIKVDCETEEEVIYRNYFICFWTYAVMITLAFFVATQINFSYHSDKKGNTEISILKQKAIHPTNDDCNIAGNIDYGSVQDQHGTSIDATDPTDIEEARPRDNTSMRDVFRTYGTIKYGSVLCVVWFAGFGMGLLFAFLYWHLEELGGPASLFGLAAVVNHSSEVLTYFFSHSILQSIGHIPALCIGLSCYAIRCLAISILVNPWWVLVIETLQGLTHALIWAAATSLVGQAMNQGLRSSAQGILQGVHHGLGRGCGAIFGGLLVNAFGTEQTFRGFGVACLVVMLFLILLQSPLILGDDAGIFNSGKTQSTSEENTEKEDEKAPLNGDTICTEDEDEQGDDEVHTELPEPGAHLDGDGTVQSHSCEINENTEVTP